MIGQKVIVLSFAKSPKKNNNPAPSKLSFLPLK